MDIPVHKKPKLEIETSQQSIDLDGTTNQHEFEPSNLEGSDSGSPSIGSSQRGARHALEEATIIVKVRYRDDTIRFKVSFHSMYADIQEQVARRFRLKMDTFDLKYLDDDEEWVMFTCNADLEECFDILKSSGGSHIKLMVRDRTLSLGSSSGETEEYTRPN